MCDFVETKSSRLKKSPESFLDTVVFKKHKRVKSKNDLKQSVQDEPEARETKNLDMKKARFDIMKFGTAGLKSLDKEQSRIALAISLGAKPPKRKYENYKNILSNNKRKKIEDQKSNQSAKGKVFLSTKKMSFRSRPIIKKKPKGLLDVYGKVTQD